jgi:restriction endonuclease S subunit
MKGMVNKSRFENINLLFPPVDQQQNYGRISLKIESLRAKHNAHLRQLERLSKSLEDYAFRGRL